MLLLYFSKKSNKKDINKLQNIKSNSYNERFDDDNAEAKEGNPLNNQSINVAQCSDDLISILILLYILFKIYILSYSHLYLLRTQCRIQLDSAPSPVGWVIWHACKTLIYSY